MNWQYLWWPYDIVFLSCWKTKWHGIFSILTEYNRHFLKSPDISTLLHSINSNVVLRTFGKINRSTPLYCSSPFILYLDRRLSPTCQTFWNKVNWRDVAQKTNLPGTTNICIPAVSSGQGACLLVRSHGIGAFFIWLKGIMVTSLLADVFLLIKVLRTNKINFTT